MQMAEFVGIDINSLGYELSSGCGDKCVDFQTGVIVSAQDCPEAEIGEGRPGLKQGKRFIRIPSLDEVSAEFLAEYTNIDRQALRAEERQARKRMRKAVKRGRLPEGILDCMRE
jgi:hypothetical protein